MTIYVKSDPRPGQREGDWVVKNGAGRGGAVLNRHRTKEAAVKEGRAAARARKTTLKIQNTRGQWTQGPSYG